MFKVIISLTETDIETKELVVSVSTKGQAAAIKAGTANLVKAEITKVVEL